MKHNSFQLKLKYVWLSELYTVDQLAFMYPTCSAFTCTSPWLCYNTATAQWLH